VGLKRIFEDCSQKTKEARRRAGKGKPRRHAPTTREGKQKRVKRPSVAGNEKGGGPKDGGGQWGGGSITAAAKRRKEDCCISAMKKLQDHPA